MRVSSAFSLGVSSTPFCYTHTLSIAPFHQARPSKLAQTTTAPTNSTHPALYDLLTNMTASTPRNPPPQSPYYSNYAQNGGISPNNGTTKLPGVPEQSNGDETPPPKKEQRLIVVSNRLPVTIQKDANGEYQFAMSSGGLVSALSGCKKSMSFTWIGWPGKHVRYHCQQVSRKLTNRSLKPTVLLLKRDCWKSTAVTQYISQMTLPSSTTMVSLIVHAGGTKLTF